MGFIINEAKYLYYIGQKFHIRSNLDSANHYYTKSLQLIPESYPGAHVHKFRIMALCQLATIQHKNLNNPAKAIEHLEDAIKRCDEHFYPGYRLLAHSQLASIVKYKGDIKTAIQIAEDALDHNHYNRVWHKGGHDYLHFALTRELAELYRLCEDCDKQDQSLELLDESLQYYESIDDIEMQAEILSDLAVHYSNNIPDAKSSTSIEEARELAKIYGHQTTLNYVNYNYSKYLLNQSRYEESIVVLDEVIQNTKHDLLAEQKANHLLAEAYTKINDYKRAKIHAESSAIISTEIEKEYRSQKLQRLLIKHDKNKHEGLILLLQRRSKLISNLVLVSIGLLILTVFLLVIAIYSRRKISKQNNELQEANKAKNELFLMLSHDLKGPISSFDNLTQRVTYLLERKEYDRLEKLTDYINNSGKSLKHTVTSLLDWSLSQKDNFILEPERLNVLNAIEKIVEEVKYLIDDKHVTLEINIANDSQITCDRNSFLIIYRNLISNAVRNCTPQTKVIVSAEQQSMYELTITNTSSEMTAERNEKLRSAIEKPIGEVSLKMRTSGIGLYTVSNLIRHNKGKISVGFQGTSVIVKTELPF